MSYRRSHAAAAAALLLWATVAAASSSQTFHSDTSGSVRLLDVPYLTQTEDLCGGAAVAMVLRYWGEREVFAEDFVALVDRSASGIRTDVLTSEVRRRGWQALPFHAGQAPSGGWMREQVDRGRPVIALIQVRPGRYHYVVIVAWTSERVIIHDPARAPFRVLSRLEFERAWTAAGDWALLLLPSEGRPLEQPASPVSVGTDVSSRAGPCGDLVQEMVERARTGDLEGAETGLAAALGLCPRNPDAWRELAGIRFLQSRWAEAGTLAERAAGLDSSDEHGWELLATSRFLNDEPDEALEAWNRISRPFVDLVRVEGARRTRHPVVAALVGLPPRSLLTVEKHHLAERRLRELPSAAVTRVRYRPIEGGLVEVEAAVVERPTLPRGVAPLVAAAGRAWLQREVRLEVAAPTGSGELWTAEWRWWEARPRLAFALAVPALSVLPGVAKIVASWERQSYATLPGVERPGAPAIHRADRRRAALSLADWATSSLRWDVSAALDRWADDSHLSLDVALDLRRAGDRVSMGVDLAAWMPIGSGRRLARSGVAAAWRSTPDTGSGAWLVSANFTATSAGAPFDLWPGAGGGHARTPLLRAHPLLDRGVITGDVLGRWLSQSTVEYQHPLLSASAGAIRVAAFADTARAWRLIGGQGSSPLHTDVGAGLRVVLPGTGGTMRVDVARGLRDGRVALSAGWQAPWPDR
jgi:predicted double-glycine peptidase